MSLNFPVDQTPVCMLHGRGQEWDLSTPAAKGRGWATNRTEFVSTSEVPSPVKPVDVTSVRIGEGTSRARNEPMIVPDAEVSREVAVVRDRRLKLLASQFVNQTTTEDDARLMILTERLRRQVPTVSAGAIHAVEAAVQAIDDADQSLAELNRLFGV